MADEKVRLDQLLVIKGLAQNPTKAKALIMSGKVLVNEQRFDKPGQKISINTPNIRIKDQEHTFVSRGALKLLHAFSTWPIELKDKVAIDVGASTGGFTEVLLLANVKKVYAIDVGYNQLDHKLRQDNRVISLEKTHILHVDKSFFTEDIDIAVIDVSFISLERILAKVLEIISDSASIYALIKPQFEVGLEHISKGGIVKDPRAHELAIEKISTYAQKLGLIVKGITPSPIFGTKGNKEFLIRLDKINKPTNILLS